MREIELSEAAGLAAWRAQGLRKGAGHKYIRRVPKPGGGYRYYYRTSGVTRGVGADLVPGAKFKLTHEGQAGHFEVVRRSGDRVVLKHDESGGSMVVSAEALGDLLKREHADVVNTAKERLHRDIQAARKHGSPKQIARLEARARRHGFDVPDARRQAAVDRMQAEADAADKRREPMPPAAPLDEDRPRVSMKEGALKRDGITPEYADEHGLKRTGGVALRDLPDGAVVEIRSAGELAQIATKKGDSWEVETVTGKRKRAPFTVDQERFINSTRPAAFSLYHRAATATEGADGGAGAMFTPVTDTRTSTHHDASADKSEDPVVLEYATRFLFKGKSPKVAAALTESKLSGQDNLFLGKVFINAASLEMALWRKLVEFSDEPSSVVEKFNLRKGSARQLVAYMADKHGWSNSETVEHLRRLDRIYGWDLASRPLPRIPNSRNRASKG